MTNIDPKCLTDEEIEDLLVEIQKKKNEILIKYTKITTSYEEKSSSCVGHQEKGYLFVEECDELGLYEKEDCLKEEIKKRDRI